MFTVKRSVPAVAALAVMLTACGGTDGDATTTSDPATAGDGPPTETAQPPTPSPEPTDPAPSPPPEETSEPEETPTRPPADDGSGEPDPSPGTGEPEPSPGTGDSERSDEPVTQLTVRLDPGTGGEASEWTVTCDPAGGTIGDPKAACETLDAVTPRDVDPVPKDARCTMVYGGPQTATITGRWDGTRVDLSFSRQNGCEIARWNTMDPVLPAAEGSLL